MKKPATIAILILSIASTGWCQVVDAGFSAPAQACINQNIIPDNQSANATRYEWDFCQGDLALTPTAETVKPLGGSVTTGIDMVFDGTNWYGFVTSQGTSSVLRLDYGTSIYSNPTIVNLGNVNGKTNSPTDIKIVSEGGNWYGFVYNLADPMISRIDFGTSLTNTVSGPAPITASTVLSGSGTVNGGFDIMHDGTNWDIVLTRNSALTIVRLPDVAGTPAGPDMISDVPDSFGTALGDVVLKHSGNNFYGYVVAWGNRTLQELDFGTSLFSTPTITNIAVAPLASVTPYGIDMGVDQGHHLLFISTLEGSLLKVDLGTDLANPSVSATAPGNFSIVENTLKIRLIKSLTSWVAVAPSWNTTNLYRIIFPNPTCSEFATVLTTEEPVISFPSAGPRHITLRAFGSNGWFSEENRSINITTDQAPTVDFTVNGICAGASSAFAAQVSSGVQTYDWQFGDAASASTATPTHTYVAAGTYNVDLEISADNGCLNSISKNISIYAEPVAGFSAPPGMKCTNNEFTFSNTTTDNFDGHLTYQWLVNGSQVSTTRDLKYTFTAEGDNSVELQTHIPGCFDAESITFNGMPAGPTVAFASAGKCEDQVVSFTNSSAGDITGTSWTFDNGETSDDTNPQVTYDTPGTYHVQLSVSAANGCVSTTTEDLTIYTLPQPAFSLDLPPFSCAGTPSQFHDATAAMPDSNIQSWSWTFGDTGTGTGKNPVHTYTTADSYTVALSVTTDKGCSASADQEVNIAASPVAAFNFDPSCVNQSTHFSDASTGSIVSWQWKVGSAVYTDQNPVHVFAAPGNFSMQLTVTGPNNCTSTLSKPVVVPVVPTVDFNVVNQCSGQLAVFTDLTANATDPVSQRTWTFGANGTRTGQETEFAFANAGTYPVQLQVQSQSGCIYSTSKQIVIHQSPVASFTMSDQTGPPPMHVSFTNTSAGAASYKWNFDDNSQSSTEVSPQHIYGTLGDYVVDLTATSTDGCASIHSQVVSVVVPVNELALEEFSLVMPSGGNAYLAYVRVHNNGNYRIENFTVSYSVGGGIQLKETVSGSLTAGETKTFLLSNQFVNPGAESFVCAELQNDNNLFDNKACTTLADSPVILNPNPNPAGSFLNVETVNAAPGVVTVRLYNMTGGQAYDRSFDVGAGLSRLSIDIENLAPGMYVVVISAGDVASSQKILIAR